MTIMRKVLLVAAVISAVAGANTAPTVNAGRDSTTRLGRSLSLYGTVSDDSQPNAEPVIEWTQISGPANGVLILAPDALGSMVEIAAMGVYTLRLSANDGEFTSTDDVVITVLDSIPFLVLSPVAGAQIKAGSSCPISWQVDPPGTFVNIELSTDNGLTFVKLNVEGRTNASPWIWQVPDDLPASDQCIIEVVQYFEKEHRAQSGVFSVCSACPANAAARSVIRTGAAGRGPGQAGLRSFSVAGSRLDRGGLPVTPGVALRGTGRRDVPVTREVGGR